jgi:hypothetical protein
VSRAPLPNSGVTSVGETWSVSWKGVTPPSSLVLAQALLPLSSLLLRLLASFGESLQVVTSPCYLRHLPDDISVARPLVRIRPVSRPTGLLLPGFQRVGHPSR